MAALNMTPVYAIAHHAVSALGMDINAHWQSVLAGNIGIRRYEDAAFGPHPFWGARLSSQQWQQIDTQTSAITALTAFERMAFYSAQSALQQIGTALDLTKTAFILSTTKGNIELLGLVPDEQIQLHTSAKAVANALGIAKAFTISHACVSGVIALQYGLKLLQAGRFENVVVTGCDRFTRFVLNGFQSFHAIADAPCRPFDANRKGINLGEAAATVVLSTNTNQAPLARLLSGATSNDANHISGPSRTGEELALAIKHAIAMAGLQPSDINMVSAHGTATIYNDEMESKALGLSNLSTVPVHSMKGYVGHTLGAAGVLESAMIIESIRNQMLIPTAGFETIGVPVKVNVTRKAAPADINYVLKTASGFGGCNATAIWGRN